jgi:hypothetical protein
MSLSDYIKTLPKKGMKEIETDLKKICEIEKIDFRMISIHVHVSGLSYTIRELTSEIYLADNFVDPFTRNVLRVLNICANSHLNLFELNDRFNRENNLRDKLRYAQEIYSELGSLTLRLHPFMESEKDLSVLVHCR